jgi:hypothetical protein
MITRRGSCALDDRRADGGEDEPSDLQRCEPLAEDDDGEHRDLDRHRVVEDARLDRRERPQGVVPDGEGNRGVDHRQPSDDEPPRGVEVGPALDGDADDEEHEATGCHRHGGQPHGTADLAVGVPREAPAEMRRERRGEHAQRRRRKAAGRAGRDVERAEVEEGAGREQSDARRLGKRRPLAGPRETEERDRGRDRRQEQADGGRGQDGQRRELRSLRDGDEHQSIESDPREQRWGHGAHAAHRAHRPHAEWQEDGGGQRVPHAGERDRCQIEVVEPDLDEDPGRRPQEGHEQRLGDRHEMDAARAGDGRRLGRHGRSP